MGFETLKIAPNTMHTPRAYPRCPRAPFGSLLCLEVNATSLTNDVIINDVTPYLFKQTLFTDQLPVLLNQENERR